ncbi:hypothetical protein C0Q70_19832 [Pomacea canaliculata]|uniref:Vacuolar protein sorting-associated protein 33B n=1 Tax=Pomacea canaliculata TaxID=400727 RepID=A0A2T7NDW9_POMCA|nr:hypothetical protein C0Q70_19832 [Pomacea canaliculata]
METPLGLAEEENIGVVRLFKEWHYVTTACVNIYHINSSTDMRALGTNGMKAAKVVGVRYFHELWNKEQPFTWNRCHRAIFAVFFGGLRPGKNHAGLSRTPDKKDLVIDPDLTKPLDRVAGIGFLRQDLKTFSTAMYFMCSDQPFRRVYLVRASLLNMKYIADHITAERKQGNIRDYTVIMVPRRLHVCELILENEGVLGHITLEEFHLHLFPLDTDLLSLEMPDIFKSFYLDGDLTHIHTVASSLVTLQHLYGWIPNIHTIGKGSKMVYDMMQAMQEEEQKQEAKFHIGYLFIIDRDVDYITPLCSPMTYEALLDESFGIQCGVIEFSAEVLAKPKSVKILLSSQDPIYVEIRDRHFSSVFPFLGAKAKELKTIYEKKNDLKTVGDMKNFVSQDLGRLKEHQTTLSYHISACEYIMKMKTQLDFESYIRTEHSLLDGTDTKDCIAYIEDCIYKQAPHLTTLRLLCLLSLTQDGLTPREYKSLKTDFLHSHGFEQLVTFFNLKKLGLLVEQSSGSKVTAVVTRRSQFRQLAGRLSLVPKSGEEVNLKEPDNLAYVYGGAYSPLTVRLVEYILLHESLQTYEDLGRQIAGGIYSDVKYRTTSKDLNIIVCTTSILTGQSLLEQVSEKKPI